MFPKALMDIQKEKRKLIVAVHNSAKISRVISGNYSYRTHGDIVYNDTLFSEYAQTPYSSDINFFALEIKVTTKLSVVYEILQGLKKHFQNDAFIHASIEEKLLQIELAKYALPFELEKAGHTLNEEYAKKLLKKIDGLESKLYGKKITDTPYEAWVCIAYLQKKLLKKWENLSEYQRNTFQKYLVKIQKHIPSTEKYNFPTIRKEHISFHFFRNYGNIQIQKQDYTELFRLALDVSGMQDYSILIWNNGNISLSRNALFIPESSSYNTLPLERVLRIITHEIMVHGISWKNQKRFFGRIKWANYTQCEEGLASYMEARLLGENPQTIKLQPMATARILSGEILSGDEFWNFIETYRILTWQQTSSVKKSFLRHKVYHSKKLPGSSRKDLSYIRGLIQIQEYLQKNDNDILPLFAGKLSFWDAKKYGSKHIQSSRFVSPVNISDFLLYQLSNDHRYTNYQKYIENKYPDIYTSFRDIDSLSQEKQWKLQKMLDIFSSYIYG